LLAAPVAGDPFLVNTYTTSGQLAPSIAMDPAGDFVIAWQSNAQPGETNYGIYAQRYDSNGIAVGGEIHVNTFTTGQQKAPAVAMDQNGAFVVTWQSSGQAEETGYGVYARRYNSSGSPLSGEFHVNTYTTNQQNAPAVAMDSAGDFTVVWRSNTQDGSFYGIYAQRYDAAGAAAGGETPVNTVTANSQNLPAIAMDPAGDSVITWNSLNQANGSSGFDVYARRYDPAGVAKDAAEFLVNTYTTGTQQNSAVAMDELGNFVVTWESGILSGVPQDGAGYGIYAQQFTAAGAKTGTEFKVNTYTTESQRFPAVAMDPAGDFVITWASRLQDGSLYGIYGQRYNAAGAAQDTEFQVNTYTTGTQFSSSVAMDQNGNFTVSWHSSNAQDGDTYGVYARRYTAGVAGTQPKVISSTFIWQNAPQRIEVKFDQDVSASLQPSDFQINDVNSSQAIADSDKHVTWNAATKTATVTFPTIVKLPNGNYHLHINATDITNSTGDPLTAEATADFFFVNGDANHDRTVDVSDLGILATNWQTSAQFTGGDFNYDGFVDVSDLGILATYWQFNLPAPAAPLPLAASAAPQSASGTPKRSSNSSVSSLVDDAAHAAG
jgi:hypothetical protein